MRGDDALRYPCLCSDQPDSRVINEEIAESLRMVLDSFTEEQRQVLFYYAQNYCHTEIARRIGIARRRSVKVIGQVKRALGGLTAKDPDTWRAFVEEHALLDVIFDQNF
jgi:DNA-directed RNA polymerase specialized sigma24 family protein